MNRRLPHILVTAALLTMVFAPSAEAATTWTARMGSSGVATLRVGSPDRLAFTVKGFRAAAPYVVTLRRGNCRSLGRLVLSARVATTRSGTASRTFSLTGGQKVLATLPLAIRFGTKCAAFAGAIATPTPNLTPMPTPTPTPTPSAGDTLIVGSYFMLAIPAGWSDTTIGDDLQFQGPGYQGIGTNTQQSSLTLDEVSAQVILNIRSQVGSDPEGTEGITIGGVPGRLLTYHFVNQGLTVHQLDAFGVHNGRSYEVTFANVAGTESADRALFLDVLASFGFLGLG